MEPADFLEILATNSRPSKSGYADLYRTIEIQTSARHHSFITNTPFSDLKVFETILAHLPDNSIVQLGNSTPVRYAQLFHPLRKWYQYSNRGTSGIDGCCSTAAGAAYASDKITTLITGDIGFFYDSNFLWNNYLVNTFRIIIINNGGGGIFRFIDGPDTIEELDPYIETPHELNSENIAKTFHIPYSCCNREGSLVTMLDEFYRPTSTPVILEIKTPRFVNGKILKSYFEHLKA